MVNKVNRQSTEWNKIFSNCGTGIELTSRIGENLKELNNYKTHSPVKKWVKDMNSHFSKCRI